MASVQMERICEGFIIICFILMMDCHSFRLPATRLLAISPTATGQPLFLKVVQNPQLLQSIMMGLLVVEGQMDIMHITADGCAREHTIKESQTSPVLISARLWTKHLA